MNAALAILLAALQQPPEDSSKQLTVADGLEVRLFAKEPHFSNPTCFDIDDRGRVWVAEGVNYRRHAGPRTNEPPYYLTPLRKTGDRIVILEDTDGDGACDKSTVFCEGLDIQAPMGIAIVGNKVWISQAPTMVTIEINPDGTAGKKETVLTGFTGFNGDHQVHSSYVGPDGKLYFCVGDSGGRVRFPDGRIFANDGKPYIGGIIARSNLDLTGLEVIAHNHRNQVECATDAFGNTFTTDNDHDGMQWVRFNYSMEGGDFGWFGPKGSHWRMESPGVVPILMRTGAGSPAGICIYEGTLLPEKYRGMPMHADAVGRIYCFRLKPDGAAWRVEGAAVDAAGRQSIETLSQIRQPDVLLSSKDRWFRPSDVAVGPDGSVFVSDWYDPVVGGGGMDDPWRGRIYRILPKGHDGSYRVPPAPDPAAMIASPCLATRTKGMLALKDRASLVPLLSSKDRLVRARAHWILGPDHARPLLKDPDPDFRVLGIRILGRDCQTLLRDPSAHVRRELLLKLRDRESLIELARQYDGHDRFYLEAVAIAFRGREEDLAPALVESFKGAEDRRLWQLLWVLGRPEAIEKASAAAMKHTVDALDALGTFHQPHAGDAVVRALDGAPREFQRHALRVLARNVSTSWKPLADNALLRATLDRLLQDADLRGDALQVLVTLGTRPLIKWKLSPSFPNEQGRTFDTSLPPESASEPEKLEGWFDARVSYTGQIDLRPQCAPNLNACVYAATVLRATEAVESRLLVGSDDGIRIWVNSERVLDRPASRELNAREDVVTIRLKEGINRVLLKTENRIGNWAYIVEIEDHGKRLTEITPMTGVRPMGPQAQRLDLKNLPALQQLLTDQGDAARGREVYFRSKADCGRCHKAKGEGGEIGPELSVIGTKFGKEGLLLSMLRPSDAVAPEFTQWRVRTSSGNVIAGILVQDTPEALVLKDNEGKVHRIAPKEIDDRKKSDLSPMPDNLLQALTRQDLADLLEYLSTLR